MAAGKPPFSHLVYPLPEEGGLGVHLTLDLQGAAKFGPDVQWVDEVCSCIHRPCMSMSYSAASCECVTSTWASCIQSGASCC